MSLYRIVLLVVGVAVMVLAGMSFTGHLPRQDHWLGEMLGLVLVAMWIVPAMVIRTRKCTPS